MFGTRYNIEPFYFSSALNKIPSRYQEDVQPKEGDRELLIYLPVNIRIDDSSRHNDYTDIFALHDRPCSAILINVGRDTQRVICTDTRYVIYFAMKHLFVTSFQSIECLIHMRHSPSTQVRSPSSTYAAYPNQRLTDGRILMLDEIAIHMVRRPTSSTTLSYHTKADWYATTAQELYKLVRLAGQSVYWRKLFQQSNDPTILLLTVLWHAIYSWDEALSSLYTHMQSLVSDGVHFRRKLEG